MNKVNTLYSIKAGSIINLGGDSMKVRKQGNATVLTVPAKFNIPNNVEYIAYKGEDESITFVKKEENIFDQAVSKQQEIDIQTDMGNDILVGNELI